MITQRKVSRKTRGQRHTSYVRTVHQSGMITSTFCDNMGGVITCAHIKTFLIYGLMLSFSSVQNYIQGLEAFLF